MMPSPPTTTTSRRPGSSRWGARTFATLISGIALAVVFYLGGWLYWTATTPMATATQKPAAVAAFPGNSGPNPLLVSADWLREQQTALGDRLVILDLSTIRRYERGHIPGAVHGWWQDTMDPNARVWGRLFALRSDPRGRAPILQSFGIAPDSTVVVYDDNEGRHAARIVWMLRYMGFDRASVLDGGLAAWKGSGGDVSSQWVSPRTAVPLIHEETRTRMITSTADLQKLVVGPDVVVLDTRTRDEARDDLNGTIPVGRIPGSVWVPWDETTRDSAGRLKSPDDLARLYRSAGVTPDKRIVIYGASGVATGQTWLVLTLLGYRHVSVYDDGWATWASDPALPIEPLPARPSV